MTRYLRHMQTAQLGPRVMGLDISTTTTGVSVVSPPDAEDAKLGRVHLEHLGHVDFKDCSTFWEKADKVRAYVTHVAALYVPTHVFIEQSLQAFRPGLSSAETLMTLAKFNGIVSYLTREITKFDPAYLAATSARKLVGIKVMQSAKCGVKAKDQVIAQVMAGPLADHAFPLKKNGKLVDWAGDEIDSYVIAWAGFRSSC